MPGSSLMQFWVPICIWSYWWALPRCFVDCCWRPLSFVAPITSGMKCRYGYGFLLTEYIYFKTNTTSDLQEPLSRNQVARRLEGVTSLGTLHESFVTQKQSAINW
jgi:hypothetical protein